MQTSLKLKTCCRFFIAFLKSALNFDYFERKDQSQSLRITEITNCETGGSLNVQKAIFHATLRQITCKRVPSIVEISMKLDSYHSAITMS